MQLKKVLPLRTIVTTSAGLTLASSTFVAAVAVAGYVAGDLAWLAILSGGLLCFLAAVCFSELNGMLPSAAGIRLFFSRAFNEQLALVISLLYMLVIVIGVIGAESYVFSKALNMVFPSVYPLFWVVAMLLAVTIMNILGVKISGAFQDIITYGLMFSLTAWALLSLSRLNFKIDAFPVVATSPTDFVTAIAVGIFLFVGFEWVTPLAEEVIGIRFISKGMLIALGILSVVYAIFTVAMTASVPKSELLASPAPQMLFAKATLGQSGQIWMVCLSLAATITTFNAGLLSVSRFMYASAREHILPKVFSTVSLRYFTPWVAIVTLFVIAVGSATTVFFTGRYLSLVNMAAAMESIIYTLTGLAVLFLRKKEPSTPRPYLIKGGFVIPVIASIVFAGLAVAVMVEDTKAMLYILGGAVLCTAYVFIVVPRLKKKYAVRKRPARRQVQRKVGNEE